MKIKIEKKDLIIENIKEGWYLLKNNKIIIR